MVRVTKHMTYLAKESNHLLRAICLIKLEQSKALVNKD